MPTAKVGVKYTTLCVSSLQLVSCQTGDDHRDLGFSGSVNLGLNYPEECGRAGKVQDIDVSESYRAVS
jgi:hypothetical protein